MGDCKNAPTGMNGLKNPPLPPPLTNGHKNGDMAKNGKSGPDLCEMKDEAKEDESTVQLNARYGMP